MTLTVLTGAAGAGKTTEVIRIVNDLRGRKQRSFLIATLDGGQARPALEKYDIINARSGRQVKVDFKGHGPEIREFIRLKAVVPSTFVFDEAQRFDGGFAEDWIALSTAGHSIVVSTPSVPQLERLQAAGAQVEVLRKLCDLMADGDATTILRLPGDDVTISVCDDCAEQLRAQARRRLGERLIAAEARHPIDCADPEFTGMGPADFPARAGLMAETVRAHIAPGDAGHRTYLDVGCNSGFFCKRMADLGLRASGIDIAAEHIRIGRVADSYIFNRHLDLKVQDALTWVPAFMKEHDVTSAFGIYGRLLEQHEPAAVLGSLQALMQKTRRLFFFGIGYKAEGSAPRIDRDWCLTQLREHGGFTEILVHEAGTQGLSRDVFVGIRG